MMKLEAIDYLGLWDGDPLSPASRDIVLVDYARDAGFVLTQDELDILNRALDLLSVGAAVETTRITSWQRIFADLVNLSTTIMEWLNDQGILPRGHGLDPCRFSEGFGIGEMAAAERRGDTARLDGARLVGGPVIGGMMGVGMKVGTV